MIRSIEKLRVAYGNQPIDDPDPNPIRQFERWLEEAIEANIYEPNGMNLATIGLAQKPSARIVLLKGVDQTGFLFFSHADSQKGEQIEQHPYAALTFWWPEIHRQVRIEGVIRIAPRKVATTYFAKRPRSFQIAALVKSQSETILERAELEQGFKDLQKKYRGKAIPCPKEWTGYKVKPERIEFWQGMKNRLHERIVYVKNGALWIQSRLAP